MSRSAEAWCVKLPDGRLLGSLLAGSEESAWVNVIWTYNRARWTLEEAGFRVVRVEIRELEPADGGEE